MKSFIICLHILFTTSICCGCDSSTAKNTSGDPQENEQSAASLHAQGLRLFTAGKYKEALAIWTQEISINPADANTHNNMGIASECLGDHDTAIKYHLKALELKADYAHAYYSLGIAYYRKRDFKQAVTAFQEAIRLNYNPADSYYYLGCIYEESNDFYKAIDSYKKAIELKPSYEARIRPLQKACERELAERKRFRFGKVVFCDEDKQETFCLDDSEVFPGQSISILGENGDELCYAKAGEPTEINTAIESLGGTKLLDITCRKVDNGSVAVINMRVETYKNLNFTLVTEGSSISAFEKKIRKRGLLNNFKVMKDNAGKYTVNKPVINKCLYPGKTVYFVAYDPQPLIKITDERYEVLSDSKECSSSQLAKTFILNNKYYAMFENCVCETDACGTIFIEIK